MATDSNNLIRRPLPPGFTDHTFQSKSGVELSVRVWPADPAPTKPAPFVVWTHGGAYMGGHHFLPLSWLGPGFIQRGYHLVSHNYRLGPQARLDDELDDCLEAVAWCRSNLPDVLGSGLVDVDRYVVCGDSSGGTLTGLMGHHLNPPPKAVIDVYGIVDFLAPDTKKKLFGVPKSDKDLSPWEGEFSAEELDAFLSDREPANLITDALDWDEQDLMPDDDLSAYLKTEFRYTKRIRLQAAMQLWRAMQRPPRSLLRAVFHEDDFTDDDALNKFIESMSPLRLLEAKTLYPPTAFLHGTGDFNVEVEQSYMFAKKLKEMGVPVVECYEPGETHGFDDKYTGPEIPGWDLYIQPILDFIDEHVDK
ncbi:Alpha/Beta hydrolase protein [Ilyonectria robusta]|uniref:Alpha/Beta hydrolase protein n=1 Tax=Ilyonectria robusta TaxID=1079257 RepID=UPI001E8DB399|nr:Alpha/Beta hydrolase protein [Ilyonectria robusta]KAH8694428.1 Alpha/Beta hydrolase protein [Ilyonectria robusta]